MTKKPNIWQNRKTVSKQKIMQLIKNILYLKKKIVLPLWVTVVAVSRECIPTCLDSVLPLFKINLLTESQFESIYSFICGREVYISLPTGSGKSMIFHLIPLVHTCMFHNSNSTQFKEDSIILIICPLLTLMQDQVKLLTYCGLKVVYIGGEQSKETFQAIENGLYLHTFFFLQNLLFQTKGGEICFHQKYIKTS